MTEITQPHDLSVDQQHALLTAARILSDEFTGVYGRETIERFLYSSYDQFASSASITNYLHGTAPGRPDDPHHTWPRQPSDAGRLRLLRVNGIELCLDAYQVRIDDRPSTLLGHYRHLVVIYQENHSFDNLFGQWGRVGISRSTD